MSRRSVLAGAAALPIATTLAAPATASAAPAASSGYLVGCGISDVTGPAAENGMMGYSKQEQQTAGLHLRNRARAFVFVDNTSGTRLVFVTVEIALLFQSVHNGVLARLAQRFGSLYNEQNVLLNATHTHASCGGSSHDYAYNLAILGFQQQVYDAEVDGIVEAIVAAHDDLRPGTLSLGRAELHDASVNRSKVAFELNPESDKQMFPDAIDPSVTVLRIRHGDNDRGCIGWFPTHGTSMGNNNHLISSDNKGYAAYAWEHDEKGVRYLDGQATFISAFAQTNAGDMSPNLDLKPQQGPTNDQFENTRIIGERQFQAVKTGFDSATQLSGPIDSLLCYIDLAAIEVSGEFTPDGKVHHTAPAALGAGGAAGSEEDGTSDQIPWHEGLRNPLVDALGGPTAPVPQWLNDAQSPKVIFAPLGLMPPAAWVPNVVAIQIARIGSLYLAAASGEFTIVSGLRIRRTVAAALGVPLENVLMQGYANGYHEYVATPEEYEAQQYEGGSTLFGKYTLSAYLQEFHRLATAFRAGRGIGRGPAPRDLSHQQFDFQIGVPFDSTPAGRSFGDVLTQPAAAYRTGEQAVAEFVSGHPKNDIHRRGTFLEVQRLVGGRWTRVADDGDWATKFFWLRPNPTESIARFTWDIPPGTPAGRYRLQHFGDFKAQGDGSIHPYVGTSNEFDVRSA